MAAKEPLLSVVIPVHNEVTGVTPFYRSLQSVLQKHYRNSYELLFVDDGSTDQSLEKLQKLQAEDACVRVIKLSRNFGKEIATTAGIHQATGQAVITIDADGQHPVELLPEFVARWQKGSKVVIGRRTGSSSEGLVKQWGSRAFYGLFSRLTGLKLVSGTTDYRLIDRQVQQQFNRMTERNRITRGLIDWLGFKRDYIDFTAKPRAAGKASYSFRKLCKLAIDSAISLSSSPLYVTAYIGAVVLPLSTLLGLGMAVNFFLRDPLHLHATGGAYMMVFVLFLIGILLVSQGIIGLYLSHIHAETQNRPLYILDADASAKK